MKINQLFLILCALTLSFVSFAQDPAGVAPAPKEKNMEHKAATTHATEMSEEEMMKMWMESIQLGDEHKQLAKSVGEYVYKSQMWTDPQAEPIMSEGKTSIESMMDGRYFVEKHTGSAMGMPFEGLGITAYDKVKKKYVFSWMDNMSTGIMLFEGTLNDQGEIVSYAKTINPMTGMQEQHRVVSMTTDTGMTMDYFVLGHDGSEFKTMHIDYTRINK